MKSPEEMNADELIEDSRKLVKSFERCEQSFEATVSKFGEFIDQLDNFGYDLEQMQEDLLEKVVDTIDNAINMHTEFFDQYGIDRKNEILLKKVAVLQIMKQNLDKIEKNQNDDYKVAEICRSKGMQSIMTLSKRFSEAPQENLEETVVKETAKEKKKREDAAAQGMASASTDFRL